MADLVLADDPASEEHGAHSENSTLLDENYAVDSLESAQRKRDLSNALATYLCIIVVQWLTELTINLAALFVGYLKPIRDECDYHESDASDYFISPNRFLIAGGWTMIVCLAVHLSVHIAVGCRLKNALRRRKNRTRETGWLRDILDWLFDSPAISMLQFSEALFMLSWAIVGFVLSDGINDGECGGKPAAQMVCAWSVVSFLCGAMQMCTPVPKMRGSHHNYSASQQSSLTV